MRDSLLVLGTDVANRTRILNGIKALYIKIHNAKLYEVNKTLTDTCDECWTVFCKIFIRNTETIKTGLPKNYSNIISKI